MCSSRILKFHDDKIQRVEINNIIFRNLGSVFCKDACPVYKIAENTSESLKGEIH